MVYKKISEVTRVVTGGTPATSVAEYWDNGTIPWLQSGCCQNCNVYKAEKFITQLGYDNSSTRLMPKDTVMIALTGATAGKIGYLNFEACGNQSITGILPCDALSQRFLYYYLISKRTEILADCVGGAQSHISQGYVKNIIVPILPLVQQNHIATILDKVSDLIVMRKKQLQKLDDLVKSRFIELFGDVIQNDKKWPQMFFSEIATSRLGKMLDAKQQTGKYSYPYLANFNVQWFRFELGNLNQMDFDADDQVEFALQNGDLLVCEGGEIGRCAVWHNEVQPCYFQKALHRVRCNKEIVLPDYLAWWFKYNCDHGGFAAIEGAKATIAHLPGAKLKSLLVTVPSLTLQTEFVSFVEQTDKSKLTIQQSLDRLELMKEALMQEFFA